MSHHPPIAAGVGNGKEEAFQCMMTAPEPPPSSSEGDRCQP